MKFSISSSYSIWENSNEIKKDENVPTSKCTNDLIRITFKALRFMGELESLITRWKSTRVIINENWKLIISWRNNYVTFEIELLSLAKIHAVNAKSCDLFTAGEKSMADLQTNKTREQLIPKSLRYAFLPVGAWPRTKNWPKSLGCSFKNVPIKIA